MKERSKEKKKRKGMECYDFVWIVWMTMILYGNYLCMNTRGLYGLL